MSEEQRNEIVRQLRLRSFEVREFSEIHAQVTTKKGDDGETQLLFNQSAPKWHPRIQLVGKLDFLSSLLNLAKLNAPDKERHELNRLQEKLVYVMAEVATDEADHDRFLDHYHSLTDQDVHDLESSIKVLESSGAQFTGWVEKMSFVGAIADSARAIAREAEGMAWKLQSEGRMRPVLPRWLNRLSDYLWAFARKDGQ